MQLEFAFNSAHVPASQFLWKLDCNLCLWILAEPSDFAFCQGNSIH